MRLPIDGPTSDARPAGRSRQTLWHDAQARFSLGQSPYGGSHPASSGHGPANGGAAAGVPDWHHRPETPPMARMAAGRPSSSPSAPKASAPGTRDLAGGGVEPVEQVGHRDHEHDRGELLLVEVGGGRVPDVVGDRVGPVGQPGGGLGQR